MRMTVDERAVPGAGAVLPVRVAARLQAWRAAQPRQFRAAVVLTIVLIVGLVVGGAYAMGSAIRAASVDGQLMALNSQGQDVTATQNQTAGGYNTDVRVARQVSEGWADDLLTSLQPVAGAGAVDAVRTDVAALAADARPIVVARWKSLQSPGADKAAVSAGRVQLDRARVGSATATDAAATLRRAQSRLRADLQSLSAAMLAKQATVLAAHPGASAVQQSAFVTAERAASADMTSANARAVVAAYDVLTGSPVPPADLPGARSSSSGENAQNPSSQQAPAPAPAPTHSAAPTPTAAPAPPTTAPVVPVHPTPHPQPTSPVSGGPVPAEPGPGGNRH